jgi:hypothetical protein
MSDADGARRSPKPFSNQNNREPMKKHPRIFVLGGRERTYTGVRRYGLYTRVRTGGICTPSRIILNAQRSLFDERAV